MAQLPLWGSWAHRSAAWPEGLARPHSGGAQGKTGWPTPKDKVAWVGMTFQHREGLCQGPGRPAGFAFVGPLAEQSWKSPHRQ